MEKATVAVIGTGPTGLSILKTLREDGFQVTAFERRLRVAGLWSYSENPTYTTALSRASFTTTLVLRPPYRTWPVWRTYGSRDVHALLAGTEANISKYTCGFSDFPMPEKYCPYMTQDEFQEFMEDYAKHFDLYKDIVFDATVTRVSRNETDTKWRVEFTKSGAVVEAQEFDKVAFCHGYQTKAVLPVYEGQEKFKGTFMHGQAYRTPEPFKGKKVVVVGMSASSGEVIPDLVPHASKVFVSHRHGAMPIKRWIGGRPGDLHATWRRRQISFFLTRYMPRVAKLAADVGLKILARRSFGPLDPAWRLEPFPSLTLKLTGAWHSIIKALRDGSVESLHGIRRFVGPRSVEFDDGRVEHDVDAIICCTGYRGDFDLAPFVETSVPTAYGYSGPPLYRLYMNMFPPAYADSCALLCYSAFGKSNGFTFADLTAMAISNVFQGVEPQPSRKEMERHIDLHQRWVASRWRQENSTDTSCVKQWEFQGWLHQAAGTGMENLGWGWKGWKFWWKDPEMYRLMNHGPETAHAYRYFETGKRKTWDGAKEAIIKVNRLVEAIPLLEPGPRQMEEMQT
ncbi:flavin containing monooxygenase 9 [Magnaporthiopsis poae ATCC 64411]|uniref:Flavin containing monooxygenase 9 n=1 Tax=Magnaporthiopsis poae (strain ATCC 64411 / 73-15) TaxID=644358 RepID=A0A0C4DST0_MAGP6|nr:flavin containing monooxygenase 9 [Magnaporthiopsis poae ATCC 64411]